MKKEDENEPVEIFAGTTLQADMVKCLLENAGIEAYLNDEIMGTMNPWLTAPGGAGAVKVVISKTDLEKAKPIIEEYEKNLREDK